MAYVCPKCHSVHKAMDPCPNQSTGLHDFHPVTGEKRLKYTLFECLEWLRANDNGETVIYVDIAGYLRQFEKLTKEIAELRNQDEKREAQMKHIATLLETIVCAHSWEAAARLLGNVRADDLRNAIEHALERIVSAICPSPLDRLSRLRLIFDQHDANLPDMKFVEAEIDGVSVNVGDWKKRPSDGTWELDLCNLVPSGQQSPRKVDLKSYMECRWDDGQWYPVGPILHGHLTPAPMANHEVPECCQPVTRSGVVERCGAPSVGFHGSRYYCEEHFKLHNPESA